MDANSNTTDYQGKTLLPIRCFTDEGWQNIGFDADWFVDNLERWIAEGWLENLKARRTLGFEIEVTCDSCKREAHECHDDSCACNCREECY